MIDESRSPLRIARFRVDVDISYEREVSELIALFEQASQRKVARWGSHVYAYFNSVTKAYEIASQVEGIVGGGKIRLEEDSYYCLEMNFFTHV